MARTHGRNDVALTPIILGDAAVTGIVLARRWRLR
jgi:hypothetical protein